MLLRHALPNALVPTLNVTALNLAYLVGGVVVVEKVFSYPGFGSLLVDSLQFRDLPVIEATMMIAALVYVARQSSGGYGRDSAQPAAADRMTMANEPITITAPPPERLRIGWCGGRRRSVSASGSAS